MPVECGICGVAIVRKQPTVFCSGPCKNQFHLACVYQGTADLNGMLKNIPGLLWKSGSCISNCICLNEQHLNTLIDEKLSHLMDVLLNEFGSLRESLEKSAAKTVFAKAETPVKYSDVLKNKAAPSVIIHPKNRQNQIQTKSDILQSINPLENDIQISKIRNITVGGVLIGCKNQEDNGKLKQMIQDKLTDVYEVRIVNGVNPRVRIVGITSKLDNNQILEYLIKMNSDLIVNESVCKVIKCVSLKNNNNVSQAVVQVDKVSYEKNVKSCC